MFFMTCELLLMRISVYCNKYFKLGTDVIGSSVLKLVALPTSGGS